LLQDKYPNLRKKGLGAQLEELISRCWDEYAAERKTGGRKKPFFSNDFAVSAALVGLGAPIHIFLPDVARALGADCVIPENADVANAVGAAVGRIAASVEAEVRPNHTPSGVRGYFVSTSSENIYVERREEAVRLAREKARELALKEAGERGVMGDIAVELEEENFSGQAARGQTIDFGTRVTATAVGGAVLQAPAL